MKFRIKAAVVVLLAKHQFSLVFFFAVFLS